MRGWDEEERRGGVRRRDEEEGYVGKQVKQFVYCWDLIMMLVIKMFD